jgi:hypothetical protein
MQHPRRVHFIITLLIFLALPLAAQPVEYFTDNGYGNPIATMQHPFGEFINGSTRSANSSMAAPTSPTKDRTKIPTSSPTTTTQNHGSALSK